MALRTMEGFDDNLAASRHVQADGVISSSYGVNGNGMRVGDTSGDMFAVSVDGVSGDVNTVGFNIKIVTGLTGHAIMTILGSFVHGTWSSYGSIAIEYDAANNRLEVQDRDGSTYAAANTFYTNTWYYLEFQWLVNNGAGSWELKLDTTTVASATGRDTLHTYVPIYCRIGGYNSTDIDDVYIDNFYYLDDTGSFNNDFLGICSVETDLPDGNGNSSVLVGSDGNSTDNYLLVDNNATAPPATAEYVESATEGDKDTYAMSNLTTTGTVHGIMTSLYAQKDDSGAKFVRPVVRSGGTDYPGTSFALANATYVVNDECWDVDPDTSTTWLYSGVNSAEVGPEVRDS